jgi:hypothetical protein
MSLDELGKKKDAIQAYLELVKHINTVPNLNDKTIVDWAVEGMYKGALAALDER